VTLTKVWLQTPADELIRADLVTGIQTHRTPAKAGQASHWLLDVVLLPAGSVQPDGSTITPLHRTLAHTADKPGDAPQHLARLLAQLDATLAAGIITTSICPEPASSSSTARSDTSTTTVRFRFAPFTEGQAGHEYDSEYL